MKRKVSALLCVLLILLSALAGCGNNTQASVVEPALQDRTEAIPQESSREEVQPVQPPAEAVSPETISPALPEEEQADPPEEIPPPEEEHPADEENTPTSVTDQPYIPPESNEPTPSESTTPPPPEEVPQSEPTAPAVPEIQAFWGYVIDKCCFEIPGPDEDTWDCLLMDSCRDSGYGLAIPDSNGSNGYIWYAFDSYGQELAFDVILNSNKWVQISVKVSGVLDNDIIHVKTMKEG